ncbi:hypothetical protein FQN57_001465 [Myotisia sp. PD_48]|nr:hypothetical protein FQN57_001465 [Myotisia sp. PD_48]
MKFIPILGLITIVLAQWPPICPDNFLGAKGELGKRQLECLIMVTSYRYNGTGCPPNSVSYSISDDGSILTASYQNFNVTIGPDVDIIQNRKQCDATVGLRYPGGYDYTITSVNYHGYAELARGVTGVQRSRIFLKDDTQLEAIMNLVGPFEGDFVFHDEIIQIKPLPCRSSTKSLRFQEQWRLTTTERKNRGGIHVDSLDGYFSVKYRLKWYKCSDHDD